MHASRSAVPLARLSPGYHPRRGTAYVWEIGRGRVWLGGLTIAALLMVVGSFIYFAHFSGAPPGSTYVPAHIENGMLVPGVEK